MCCTYVRVGGIIALHDGGKRVKRENGERGRAHSAEKKERSANTHKRRRMRAAKREKGFSAMHTQKRSREEGEGKAAAVIESAARRRRRRRRRRHSGVIGMDCRRRSLSASSSRRQFLGEQYILWVEGEGGKAKLASFSSPLFCTTYTFSRA